MSESFSRKRPGFNQFREWFMEVVNNHTAEKMYNPLMHWHSVGEENLRQEIIDSFLNDLEMRFGFRPLINEELHKMDSPLESLVNHIFHVFSTMLLMEHINEKMYRPQENKLH